MSNDRSLTHISLDTGDVCSWPRREIGDQVIRWLRPFLNGALIGLMPPVPGRPAWFSAEAWGTAFCARIYGRVYGERRADLEIPVITFAVAIERDKSDAMWRLLHRGRPEWMYPLATDPEQPPQLPWLAERMEPGIVDNFRMLSWLPNFAMNLAWTWIEYPR